eukprot:22430-Pyramimonas_sp.AAC.1
MRLAPVPAPERFEANSRRVGALACPTATVLDPAVVAIENETFHSQDCIGASPRAPWLVELRALRPLPGSL